VPNVPTDQALHDLARLSQSDEDFEAACAKAAAAQQKRMRAEQKDNVPKG